MNDLKFTTAGDYMNTNDRIKELAEQAEQYVNNAMDERANNKDFTFGDIDEMYNTKFAELIVAEILKTCEEHPSWSGRMIGEQIKQHFGVEEPKGWVCPKCNADRIKIACPLGFGATVDGRCPMTVEAQ